MRSTHPLLPIFGLTSLAACSAGAKPAGPRCTPTKPFAAPVALKGPITSAGHDGSPTLLPNVNTAEYELPGWVSPDNCRLYMTRFPSGPGDSMVASRPL